MNKDEDNKWEHDRRQGESKQNDLHKWWKNKTYETETKKGEEEKHLVMSLIWFVGNVQGMWELTSQMQLLADLEVDRILLVQLEDKILQSKRLLCPSHHTVIYSPTDPPPAQRLKKAPHGHFFQVFHLFCCFCYPSAHLRHQQVKTKYIVLRKVMDCSVLIQHRQPV